MLLFLHNFSFYPRKNLKYISKNLGYGFSTVKLWWSKYKKGGIEKLLEWNVKGKQARLSEEQIKKLEEKFKTDGFSNQKEVIFWIENNFGINYSQSAISKLLKKLKVKKKTGRPVNIKKDKEKEKEFREKRIKEISQKYKGYEIFFLTNQDYIYLYEAINPKKGENFELIMPDMTTNGMNIFLKKLLEYLGERKIVLIMDNASSHRSIFTAILSGIKSCRKIFSRCKKIHKK